MIRVRDIRRLAALDVEALETEFGPFVLIQKPVTRDERKLSSSAPRTAILSAAAVFGNPAAQLLEQLDEMEILTALIRKTRPLYVLGRSPASDVVVPDKSVSSRHAVIARKDTGWSLTDLGSTNGTAINGKPAGIIERTLQSGDSVTLGDAIFIFFTTAALKDILAKKK